MLISTRSSGFFVSDRLLSMEYYPQAHVLAELIALKSVCLSLISSPDGYRHLLRLRGSRDADHDSLFL
jgi:hypothetical protein